MKKAKYQLMHKQSQSAIQHRGGAAIRSPHRTAQVAAMINSSSATTAQQKLSESIRSSPRMVAQRKFFSDISNSPRMHAQRKINEYLFSKAQRVEKKGLMEAKVADTVQTMRQKKEFDPQAPLQLRTTIKHTTGNFNFGGGTERVGMDMEAWLDPNDPKQGSVPQAGELQNTMTALANANFNNMKRGHLLNDHLGGIGEDYNLYPITTQANANHTTKVENFVKNEITNGQGVYYRVRVENAAHAIGNPDADFRCTIQEWDPNAILNPYGNVISERRIESRPVIGGNGTGLPYNALTGNLLGPGTGMAFNNANLPVNWGNQGNVQTGWVDPGFLARLWIKIHG